MTHSSKFKASKQSPIENETPIYVRPVLSSILYRMNLMTEGSIQISVCFNDMYLRFTYPGIRTASRPPSTACDRNSGFYDGCQEASDLDL